jgi:hypothetical protein
MAFIALMLVSRQTCLAVADDVLAIGNGGKV